MKRQACTRQKDNQRQLLAKRLDSGRIWVWKRVQGVCPLSDNFYTPKELKPFLEGALQMANEMIEAEQ